MKYRLELVTIGTTGYSKIEPEEIVGREEFLKKLGALTLEYGNVRDQVDSIKFWGDRQVASGDHLPVSAVLHIGFVEEGDLNE